MSQISRISRAQLLLAIEPVNGRVPTLQAIGDPFGMSREGVRQRLRTEGLIKRHAPKQPKASAGDLVRIKPYEQRGLLGHAGHYGRVIGDARYPSQALAYVFACECGSTLRISSSHFDKLRTSSFG